MVNQGKSIKTRAGKPAQREYNQDDRIRAVTAALTVSAEHPTSNASMAAARAILNAPIAKATLQRWIADYRPAIANLQPTLSGQVELLPTINAAVEETVNRLQKIRDVYGDHLLKDDVINKSSSRDAAVVMGISQTHLSTMQGMSPERRSKLDELERLFLEDNRSLDRFLDSAIEHQRNRLNAASQHDVQLITSSDNPSDS